jgi:myotubularin-related protein 9
MEFVELIKAPKVDKVILRRTLFPTIEGTLCLTGHHLILSSRREEAQELWVSHLGFDPLTPALTLSDTQS